MAAATRSTHDARFQRRQRERQPGAQQNLLSQNEVQSLLGNKYTILTTTDGVNGRFENANPAYPFVNVTLDYQVMTSALASPAPPLVLTPWPALRTKAVARAVETLNATEPVTETVKAAWLPLTAEALSALQDDEGKAQAVTEEAGIVTGHPVYESFLGFTSAESCNRRPANCPARSMRIWLPPRLTKAVTYAMPPPSACARRKAAVSLPISKRMTTAPGRNCWATGACFRQR